MLLRIHLPWTLLTTPFFSLRYPCTNWWSCIHHLYFPDRPLQQTPPNVHIYAEMPIFTLLWSWISASFNNTLQRFLNSLNSTLFPRIARDVYSLSLSQQICGREVVSPAIVAVKCILSLRKPNGLWIRSRTYTPSPSRSLSILTSTPFLRFSWSIPWRPSLWCNTIA